MRIIKSEEIKDIIKDGDVVVSTGFTSALLCDHVFRAMEKSFLECGHPKDIELVSIPMLGNKVPGEGMDRLSHKGLLRGLRTTHINMVPGIQKAVMDNEIYCYMYPFGCLTSLYRDIGAGKPGTISKVGLGTFIDPRIEGGKCNERSTEATSAVMEIDGEEYLFYKAFPMDVAVLRGTSADEKGNITCEDEILFMESLEIAQAVKHCGGKVIVQVKKIVPEGTLKPREVMIPGVLVDYVITAPPEHHMQTMATGMNEDWTHRERVDISDFEPVSLNERKIIARRAAMEIEKGSVINLGMGIPELVGALAAEEGFQDDITLTVECGIVGGVPVSGLDFGGCYNPEYVTASPHQMDWYDGGGLDACILSAAEVDRFGNTNVTKFGRIVGPGGYINIATGSRTAVFCGTFTAGGLRIKTGDGRLNIVREGQKKKFVKDVEQITYSGKLAAARGQRVTYVTERAVFRLKNDAVPDNGEPMLELIEIAPGIDMKTQILDMMDFEVTVAKDLKIMDERIFREGSMGCFQTKTQ